MLPEADRRGSTAGQPKWTNQQIHRVLEECWLIAFDCVSHELQNPADNKQQQSPAPVEEEQRQRKHYERNANAVRQSIQRMLMLRFVVL